MCLQPYDKPHYVSISAGWSSIIQKEGWKGLYRGLVPSLFGVSHGAIHFMVYEEIKKYTLQLDAADTFGSTLVHMFNGMFSKLIASVSTYPYQVLKTRLQMCSERHTMSTWIKEIWKKEGWIGFYKGLGPNVLRVMPGTCVTFVVYESMCSFFKSHGSSQLA